MPPGPDREPRKMPCAPGCQFEENCGTQVFLRETSCISNLKKATGASKVVYENPAVATLKDLTGKKFGEVRKGWLPYQIFQSPVPQS